MNGATHSSGFVLKETSLMFTVVPLNLALYLHSTCGKCNLEHVHVLIMN